MSMNPDIAHYSHFKTTGDFSCSMGNNSKNSTLQGAEEELWIGPRKGMKLYINFNSTYIR